MVDKSGTGVTNIGGQDINPEEVTRLRKSYDQEDTQQDETQSDN